jgi:formylmethanofuran:tetrahydromethanopterin formyltransferase
MGRKIIKKVKGTVVLANMKVAYKDAVKRVTKKICSVCDTEKDIDEFSKNTAAPDGHCAQCKQCTYDKAELKRRMKREEDVFLSIF